MITKLKIVLKTGEVKKYPWRAINFSITDERVTVTRNNTYKTFLFRAPMSNVEYCEAIEEDEEVEVNDCDVAFLK